MQPPMAPILRAAPELQLDTAADSHGGVAQGLETLEERLVVDVVSAVARKGHADHPVDQVDRRVSQVNGFVRKPQPFELVEHRRDVVGMEQGFQVLDGEVAEVIEKAVLEHLLPDVHPVAVGVVAEPAGKLARRIVDLHVERALAGQQRAHDGVHAIDLLVEEAIHPML